MKKKRIYISLIAIFVSCMVIPTASNAQIIRNGYVNVDWQLNLPVGESFADQISGWGAQIDGGYYVTNGFSVGLFASFHTNNKYIGKMTIPLSETASITSDQQHSIFHIPFGGSFRYTFLRENRGIFEPYIGTKLGADYSEVSTIMNIFKTYDREWGFYVSPEIGFTLYTSPAKVFGFHMAAYYNYSTNKSEVLSYSLDGLSNIGFRFGISF